MIGEETVYLAGSSVSGFGLGRRRRGWNFFRDVVRPTGHWYDKHVAGPINDAANRTGVPQWANRYVIQPIVEPVAKEAALVALDVEFGGLHTLINMFIPTPIKELLHGLANVAAQAIRRGIEGQPQQSIEKIVDTMVSALTFLGDAMFVVRGLLDAAIDLKRVDAPTVTYLMANWSAPPGTKFSDPITQNRLNAAKATFDLIDPKLRSILSFAAKTTADLASTGKIRRSDIQDIVGHDKVLNKILDLFGIRDEPPPHVIENPVVKNAPPEAQHEMKKAASAAVFAAATANHPSQANEAAQQAAHAMLAVHPATQHLTSTTAEGPQPVVFP
jgi:hypothetical protein